jgi:hypothetical protein
MRFNLLAKTEDVLDRIDIPFVIAFDLNASLNVAVCLFVHFGEFWFLIFCTQSWEQDVFRTLAFF